MPDFTPCFRHATLMLFIFHAARLSRYEVVDIYHAIDADIAITRYTPRCAAAAATARHTFRCLAPTFSMIMRCIRLDAATTPRAAFRRFR